MINAASLVEFVEDRRDIWILVFLDELPVLGKVSVAKVYQLHHTSMLRIFRLLLVLFVELHHVGSLLW